MHETDVEDVFALDVRVITDANVNADAARDDCPTDDGCAPTCASACASE